MLSKFTPVEITPVQTGLFGFHISTQIYERVLVLGLKNPLRPQVELKQAFFYLQLKREEASTMKYGFCRVNSLEIF